MQAYSDPKRESEPHALPDIEVWQDRVYTSRCCNTEHPESYATACADQPCLTCEQPARFKRGKLAWFWWSCFPGCMPDGEPNGPFDTEDEALADARAGMEDDDDYGCDDDEEAEA